MLKDIFAQQLVLEVINPREHENVIEVDSSDEINSSNEIIEYIESQPLSEKNSEENDDNIEILEFNSDLPGAPKDTKAPEIEVKEEEEINKVEDIKPIKDDPWNLLRDGHENFFILIKNKMDNTPKHSGTEESGLERAIAYLERLDSEISKCMRNDLDSKLDAFQVEKARATIEDGINRLQDRLDKIKKSKKKTKKKADNMSEMIVKEAQKILGVQGLFVTVPLFISRLGRICINSSVSAGHDINKVFNDQVDKYKLDDREVCELQQFIEDCGYTVRGDRGYSRDENIEVTDGKFDWSSSYQN